MMDVRSVNQRGALCKAYLSQKPVHNKCYEENKIQPKKEKRYFHRFGCLNLRHQYQLPLTSFILILVGGTRLSL
jgi:hypothetical protein